jgi:exonuclease SbcD
MNKNKPASPIAVLINDPHLSKDNAELVKDIFRQAIEVCKKFKVDSLFCSGDVFTNRSGQPLSALKAFREILTMLRESKIEFFVIPGNHDKTDASSNDSYLDAFVEEGGYASSQFVHVFREMERVQINERFSAWFVPYFENSTYKRNIKAAVEFISEDDNLPNAKNILITHAAFNGVKNNDGTVVEDVIKRKSVEIFDAVFVGHYHNASSIGKNIHYTGAAYQNNFGENVTDKGFTVVYDDASFEHVPSKFPRYIREDVQARDKATLRNLIEKYEGKNGDYVRFVFHGRKEDCDKINIAQLAALGIGYKFETDEEVEAMEYSQSDAVASYTKKEITRDFIAFCKENEIKGEKFSYGLSLIKLLSDVES